MAHRHSGGKVILINGFAGSGKTTIARLYIDNHPLAIVIEGDELIVNISDWLANDKQARRLVFELIKVMVETAIKAGYDVVLPYLVTDADEAAEIERIAVGLGAKYYEFYLKTDRDHAINMLLQRGTWGEAGLPPLTKDDMPTILKLYEDMEAALRKRPHQIPVAIKEGRPATTYEELLGYIAQ